MGSSVEFWGVGLRKEMQASTKPGQLMALASSSISQLPGPLAKAVSKMAAAESNQVGGPHGLRSPEGSCR